MHIYNIGIDIIERLRVKRLIEKNPEIVQRLCTIEERSELEDCKTFDSYVTACARLFAIKEAVMKACGTGWQEGVGWQDISVHNTLHSQRPVLRGKLSQRAGQYNIDTVIASVCGDSHLIAANAYAVYT